MAQTTANMKKMGINDKIVFYVKRHSEPQLGSYFEYTEKKEICDEGKKNPYFLKVGGVAFLPKKPVPGKKISTSAERIKESEYYGSYVYFGDTDDKLRTLLYARRKCLPDGKLVSQPGILHSVIPRYANDDYLRARLILGMKVTENSPTNRQWSKYDTPSIDHPGMIELYIGDDFMSMPRINDVFSRRTSGIYVGENTSALMVDTTRAHLYNDFCRNYVYTLFQSGSFICANTNVWYCFYDEEEGEDYDVNRLLLQKRDRLSGSQNLDLLRTRPNESKVIFLKSASNHTFWTFRVHKVKRWKENEFQICIPSGGQFENVYNWEEGVQEVMRRQSLKPWRKYIQRQTEDTKPERILSELDPDRDEAYPQ